MEWETVIGLEVHAQLATRSKIFSGAATRLRRRAQHPGLRRRSGLPGVLPVLNGSGAHGGEFGLAIDAEIAQRSVFDRKNYFYPDLPKGYQISQFELPIVGTAVSSTSTLEDGSSKTHRHHPRASGRRRRQVAARGFPRHDRHRPEPRRHAAAGNRLRTGYALRRGGRGLPEELHALVRYLGICDGNMQEGSLRCDANVSVRPKGQDELGTRTEIKNLNSFRFVEQAINYEIERQIDVLEDGGKVVQETRLYDADKNETRSMRSKEEANDYRYFPDPDLLPVVIDEAFIDAVRRAAGTAGRKARALRARIRPVSTTMPAC